MLITVLFTITKAWKQPKYPSTDEWVYIYKLKKNIYIYIYKKLNHFAVHQKLTQHCKSTTLQF